MNPLVKINQYDQIPGYPVLPGIFSARSRHKDPQHIRTKSFFKCDTFGNTNKYFKIKFTV